MLKSRIAIAAVLLTMAGAASAQTSATPTTASAAPTPGATSTTISPEKKKLIERLLQLWPVENVGVIMLQNPVMESMRQSRSLLQGRVSAETQEAAMKDIAQDAKKFVETTTPIVTSSAQKLIPTTVVPMLAQKFSEEELRQLIAILESPVKAKFEAAAPEMEKALGEKIATDTGAQVNPKMTELTQEIGLRMRAAITPQ